MFSQRRFGFLSPMPMRYLQCLLQGLLPRLSYIARLFQDNHPESITTAVLHHLDKIKACRLKFVATDMEIIKASRGKALPPLSQAERFAYSHMDTLQVPTCARFERQNKEGEGFLDSWGNLTTLAPNVLQFGQRDHLGDLGVPFPVCELI